MALVRGLHGIRGAARVEVLTDDPEARFAIGTSLFPEGTEEALTIVEARPADPGWVLRFREVPTREAAERLRMRYLEISTAGLPPLPEGRFYWHELLDLVVRDPAGGELGTVREVYRSGESEVLAVEGGPRGSFDVPIASHFIRALAPARGEVVVDPDALDLPAADALPASRPPRPPRPRRATRRRPAVPMPPPRPRPLGEPGGSGEAGSAGAAGEPPAGPPDARPGGASGGPDEADADR